MMPLELNEKAQTVWPHFESGTQLCGISDKYSVILLCGGGATRTEKLAFVCQYADVCQQKILLLDECGTCFPRHRAIHKKTNVPINRVTQKLGRIDVLRGAAFGKKAEYYAAAWCNSRTLIDAGYQRVFIATEHAVNPWTDGAVVFPGKNESRNTRLLQFLYDADVVILGIAGKCWKVK